MEFRLFHGTENSRNSDPYPSPKEKTTQNSVLELKWKQTLGIQFRTILQKRKQLRIKCGSWKFQKGMDKSFVKLLWLFYKTNFFPEFRSTLFWASKLLFLDLEMPRNKHFHPPNNVPSLFSEIFFPFPTLFNKGVPTLGAGSSEWAPRTYPAAC
jgi:hypothetical protein